MKKEKYVPSDSLYSVQGYACVIMASGTGKRFGGNKPMADFGGKPMIQWILDATEGLFDCRVVVTRSHETQAYCKSRGVNVVLHDLPGRNDTVRIGLESVNPGIKGCMFCPADQPLIRKETLRELLLLADREKGKICRPVCGENVGTPVVFPKWSFEELKKLPEGKGGNWLIQEYPQEECRYEISNPMELMDIDTPGNLEEAKKYL